MGIWTADLQGGRVYSTHLLLKGAAESTHQSGNWWIEISKWESRSIYCYLCHISSAELVWCDPSQPFQHEEQFQLQRSDQQQSLNNFQQFTFSFSHPPQNQWSGAQNLGTGPSQHAGRYADPDPGFRPQQAYTGITLASPLAALRSWFPLLMAMPDAMMATTDLPTQMTLNNSLKPDPRQGGDGPDGGVGSHDAKFSGSLNKMDKEPGTVEAGRD